jgi:hypothetical protein
MDLLYHMADNFVGVIIEESLENRDVLKKVKIIKTKIGKVTDRHQTPWLSKWTLHIVEVHEDQVSEIAREISKAFDSKHGASWYADFKNKAHHFIIFRNKIFFIDGQSKEQYDEVKQYGLSLGIPEYQLDFHS